jgi:hypothetical protein
MCERRSVRESECCVHMCVCKYVQLCLCRSERERERARERERERAREGEIDREIERGRIIELCCDFHGTIFTEPHLGARETERGSE